MLKNTYQKTLKIIKFSYSGEVLGFVFGEWQNDIWHSMYLYLTLKGGITC